jgi:hypothetical protein
MLRRAAPATQATLRTTLIEVGKQMLSNRAIARRRDCEIAKWPSLRLISD